MAKKIKYYGVFVVKSLGESEFVKTMTETLGLPKLQKKQFAVFVFDNELEQVDMLSTIIATHRGCEAIHVDATSKEDFLEQIRKLKEKYEEEVDDDCEEPINEREEARYNVVLTHIHNNDIIPTVKAVKNTLGIGLKEAKELVGNLPSILAERVDEQKAVSIVNSINASCHCELETHKMLKLC